MVLIKYSIEKMSIKQLSDVNLIIGKWMYFIYYHLPFQLPQDHVEVSTFHATKKKRENSELKVPLTMKE